MPLHDGGRDILVELAGGEIIQEKQWLGALNDNVVDAHGHEVNADRVVHAALDGDLHLGADAVVGGDQDRVDKARRLEIEQSAESAKLRARSRTARGASERTDPVHDPVADIDVDPQFGVGERFSAFGHPGSQGFGDDRGNCPPRNAQERTVRPGFPTSATSCYPCSRSSQARGEVQGRAWLGGDARASILDEYWQHPPQFTQFHHAGANANDASGGHDDHLATIPSRVPDFYSGRRVGCGRRLYRQTIRSPHASSAPISILSPTRRF